RAVARPRARARRAGFSRARLRRVRESRARPAAAASRRRPPAVRPAVQRPARPGSPLGHLGAGPRPRPPRPERPRPVRCQTGAQPLKALQCGRMNDLRVLNRRGFPAVKAEENRMRSFLIVLLTAALGCIYERPYV